MLNNYKEIIEKKLIIKYSTKLLELKYILKENRCSKNLSDMVNMIIGKKSCSRWNINYYGWF